MQFVTPIDCSRIAQDLQIRKLQVESVAQLLDEGNTVPFITRYRKERTGGLNEELIRQVQKRIHLLRQLVDRRQTILKSLDAQGKLTEELRIAIHDAETIKRLEDLYLPYKPKKRTLATLARERGLEPLALAVWQQDPAVANLEDLLPTLVNPEKELPTPADVRLGVQHLLAEIIAETADVRAAVRSVLWDVGSICASKSEKLGESQGLEYKDYFQFTESIRFIPPHRILALNRGEKEGPLRIRLDWNPEAIQRTFLRAIAEAALQGLQTPLFSRPAEPVPGGDSLPVDGQPAPVPPPPPPLCPPREMSGDPLSPDAAYRSPHVAFLKIAAEDALNRLLLPSLEREIRRELTDEAEAHAVSVFARNLRGLLLAPPLRGRRVLALDPGFRTGCKVAALDETGNLLEETVVYPHPPQKRKDEARARLAELIIKHQAHVIALGNGTGCRETEELVSDIIAEFEKRRQRAAAGLPEEPPAVPVPVPAPEVASATAALEPEPAPAAALIPEHALAALANAVPGEALVVSAFPLPGAPPDFVCAPGAVVVPPELAALAFPVEGIALPSAPAPRPAPLPIPFPPGLAPADLAYVIVNEAGASVYSASAIGREEFPTFDATLRGTISIGRRLQDPLSELVKVDPQHIGVGLYQHDVNPRHLKESLEDIVESCVNQVGVDLNTASVPLLRHVSGLNQLVARDLVDYRKRNGLFRTREQLLQVPNVGPARFVQAAGFLKIPGGDDPLDRTWVHPESYGAARKLLAELGYASDVLEDPSRRPEFEARLKTLTPEDVAARLEVGVPTLRDILEALARPGRDPREDLPPPVFRKGILKLEDLQPGMELKGTVLNVVDFGAFVDIGLKDSGLVHISQMANRYIKCPYDMVSVGDVVTVWVLKVDKERRRVSLAMVRPGTERHAAEKKPPPPPPRPARAEGGGPPRGGRRPGPRQGHAPQPAQGAAAANAPPATAQAPAASRQAGSGPPAAPGQRTLPPRRPRRDAPRPKLSQDALEGKAPLRTLGELAAFFAAKRTPAELEKKPEKPAEAEVKEDQRDKPV